MEAVDPVFQAKMLDMLKQTGRWECTLFDGQGYFCIKVLLIFLCILFLDTFHLMLVNSDIQKLNILFIWDTEN